MKLFSKDEIHEKIAAFWQQHPQGIVSVCGPTSCGKTSLSLEIAQRHMPAEIISVDSRQIYKDINIGSAKITLEQMQGITHHGLDLVTPEQPYNVYQFQQYAFETLDRIHAQGAKTILCGGTMLWLDAITQNYIFADHKSEKSEMKGEPKYSVLNIGVWRPREELYARIDADVQQRFENGLVQEYEMLAQKYPNMTPGAATSTGILECKSMKQGLCTPTEARHINQKRNRNYAKRQLTWWRGRTDIVWMNGSDTQYIDTEDL